MSEKKVPEQESDDSVNAFWWIVAGIVLIGLAVLTAPFLISSSSFELNGFTFEESQCAKDRTCWDTVVVTNVARHPVTFYTDPREVDVDVDPAAIDRAIATTQNPDGRFIMAFEEAIEGEGVPGEVGIAILQVSRITGERLFDVPTQAMVYGRDVVCSSSNENVTVVYFTQGPQDAILLDERGCIVLEARTKESIITVGEAFTMYLTGILWAPV